MGSSGKALGQKCRMVLWLSLSAKLLRITALQNVQELLALSLKLSSHIFRRLAMFEKLLFLKVSNHTAFPRDSFSMLYKVHFHLKF